jgi:hypothetical protein
VCAILTCSLRFWIGKHWFSLVISVVLDSEITLCMCDRYVYYYECDNPAIQVRYLTGLIALINEQLGSGENNNPGVMAHYRNTINYIKRRQQDAETSEKFLQIQV